MFSIVMSMKLWLILQRLRYKTAWHSMEMKTSIKNVPISKFKLFFFKRSSSERDTRMPQLSLISQCLCQLSLCTDWLLACAVQLKTLFLIT